MTIVKFNAYEITEVTTFLSAVTGKDEKLISIKLSMGGGRPFPSDFMETNKLTDVKTSFAAYVALAKSSGQQLQLSAHVTHGRKPNGFDKAKLTANVNI